MQPADVKKQFLLTLKCQDAVALACKQIYIAAATVNASAMPVLCTQYFRAQGIHSLFHQHKMQSFTSGYSPE